MSSTKKTAPPDHFAREQALDAGRSVLVQAPAGSGKTDLLTRRFLRLLGEVDKPGQIVAITFTKAAAAEMRHRILSELEKAATREAAELIPDEFSMEALAHRALARSQALGWNLLDLPAQLRISTIDSFCRDLALQQPLLSGLGGGLDVAERPGELYRRAARRTLEAIGQQEGELTASIEALLRWRDNGWREMENLLVEMLEKRDRWMQQFILDRNPDWEALRAQLERPFQKAVTETLSALSWLLDQVPGAREEALQLARLACEEPGDKSPWGLAECSEIPAAPFAEGLDSAREMFAELANFLQTQKGNWRSEKGLKAPEGFPATTRGRSGKARFGAFIAKLEQVSGLEAALASVRTLPPARYTEEDWKIVRACFVLLRHAAAQLKVIFAEEASVDFIEVAQIAESILQGEDGLPTDAALAIADDIRHLLVDEFQDTSRRQHQLLAGLIAAWPEREQRTCFVVGDPMQSIYFFRDADAELFPRVRENGLEIAHDQPLRFDAVRLFANFRTASPLVDRLNTVFSKVFEENDGSGVSFAEAVAARAESEPAALLPAADTRMHLHLEFVPQAKREGSSGNRAGQGKKQITAAREAARTAQIAEIVDLIRSRVAHVEQARSIGRKYRIAVLGRTRTALAPIATALREAQIPFRAIDLEDLRQRPEVLDALALGRALLNPQDRVAWLGVLRAPWCGLSLADLHALTSADDENLVTRPVPELLAERAALLSAEGQAAAARVLRALEAVPSLRFAQPTASVGTWLEQVWLRLGGDACVDATAHANLDLLWRSLDRLPDGEQDLLGSALDAALDKLAALPDPSVDSEYGVQLMTIHKSKGLEFEVVIVPELQARAARTRGKLLAWMERGLAEPDEAENVTEFLVAPLQPKGADRGKAKEWVDRVYGAREAQEMRRILYVAATRAREELHLFARPTWKAEQDGSPSLKIPTSCLLATAWPALQQQITERFAAWRATHTTAEEESEVVDALAASGESNLLVMPAPKKHTLLRRLPLKYEAIRGCSTASSTPEPTMGSSRLYERHEGGLISRALGSAVHVLLMQLAQLHAAQGWQAAQSSLPLLMPRIAAQVRAAGVDASQAERIAAQAQELAQKAAQDPLGQWILSPHTAAASEARWAGVVAGKLRTVQVDRIFQAGLEPLSQGNDAWWIIDYKTAHAEESDPAVALPQLRRIFAPQVEAYAQVLRNLYGDSAVLRGGLYYPRIGMLDWWKLE